MDGQKLVVSISNRFIEEKKYIKIKNVLYVQILIRILSTYNDGGATKKEFVSNQFYDFRV